MKNSTLWLIIISFFILVGLVFSAGLLSGAEPSAQPLHSDVVIRPGHEQAATAQALASLAQMRRLADKERAQHPELDPLSSDYRARSKDLTQGLEPNFRFLVVRFRFIDEDPTIPFSELERRLFSGDSNSVSCYFDENSYGTFCITGDTITIRGSVSQTMAYYADGDYGRGWDYPKNGYGLMDEVLDSLSSQYPDIDFGYYDNDGDNRIEGILIFYPGLSGGQAGCDRIWNAYFPNSYYFPDGHYVDGAALISEAYRNPDMTIGCQPSGMIDHEIGHILGLPDMYNTTGGGGGIGPWCLMATGSQMYDYRSPSCLCSWCKIQLGWAISITLTDTCHVTLAPWARTGIVYQLDAATPGEYWIIGGNRQPVESDWWVIINGFWNMDRGLAIYHIDSTYIAAHYWTPNNDPSHYGIQMEWADGTDDGFFSLYGPATGYDTFSALATATPNSYDWSGAPTGIYVSDIVENADSSITCFIRPSDNTLLAVREARAATEIFTPLELIPTGDAIYVNIPATLTIFDLAGRLVWQGNSHGRQTLPAGLGTGLYLVRAQAGSQTVTHKFILVR